MCLGVPGKVIQLMEHNTARVDVDGNEVDISIKLTPKVQLGQHVLIHAGFAVEIIDETLAEETMRLLKELQPYDN
ncbi:MAG: HypC/HybG/HupF family hydrogenase formation chaperone [Syntrophomonas sp.]